MHAIPNPTWDGIVSYTWADLTPHQWECFRTALFELGTEASTTGVAIVQPNHPRRWNSLVKTRYNALLNKTWYELTVISNVGETVTEQSAKGVLILQSPVIMQTETEMISNITVSERDYNTNMLRYLPTYERKSRTIQEIIKSYDREFRNAEQNLEVSKRNQQIDTAIENLWVFERDLGIRNRVSLNYQQRREQIISRNIASFSQTTEDVIKQVAAAYSNGEVDVNKTNVSGVYEIKFVGTRGIPDNLEGLKDAIDVTVPAHLQFEYSFVFNSWSFLANRTWEGVSGMSWNELRTWEGVS